MRQSVETVTVNHTFFNIKSGVRIIFFCQRSKNRFLAEINGKFCFCPLIRIAVLLNGRSARLIVFLIRYADTRFPSAGIMRRSGFWNVGFRRADTFQEKVDVPAFKGFRGGRDAV